MTNAPKIKIKKLFEDAVVPSRAFPTDSGLYPFIKLNIIKMR